MSNLAQGWSWRENPHTYRTEGSLLVDGRCVGSVMETREGDWVGKTRHPWPPKFGPATMKEAVSWVEDDANKMEGER